jgi:hypothetical protein
MLQLLCVNLIAYAMSEPASKDTPKTEFVYENCKPHQEFIGSDNVYLWKCNLVGTESYPCSFRLDVNNFKEICHHPALSRRDK